MSTEKYVGRRYVVLDFMFKFALGEIKIRHVAAEKIGNGVLPKL